MKTSAVAACVLIGMGVASAWSEVVRTPRDVALEIFLARDAATIEAYLPEAARQELRKLPDEDRQAIVERLAVGTTIWDRGGRLERVDRGQTVILATYPGRPGKGGEVRVEREETAGDRATVVLSLFDSGASEASAAFVVRLRKENEVWRIVGAIVPGVEGDEVVQLLGMLDIPLSFASGVERFSSAQRERRAIEELRNFVSAEASYSGENGGDYGAPECLVKPAGCIANYTGAPFLDAALVTPVSKDGFRRTFHPGPAAPGAEAQAGTPHSKLRGFAYVAVPSEPGPRGFCADDSGRVCSTADGAAPPVRNGRCPEDCTKVE